ncbi:MAG: anion permease [Chloroflexota bacterium]
MDKTLVAVGLVVILGLAFEFVNGFHDAANAIATVVATRVLTPARAVLMAGVLNFLGAISGTAVATTLGRDLVDPGAVDHWTVAVGLSAAIIWDLVTWYAGLPTSSSHALIFGVVGSAVAAGLGVVKTGGLFKVGAGLVYSPVLGFLAAAAVMAAIFWVFQHSTWWLVTRLFGRLQLLSAAWMAFSHGSNDGQKTMGVIALALFGGGLLGPEFYVPIWVMVAAALAIALGTTAGGWRIIKTLGYRVAHLQPVHGFAAETAAGTVIEVASRVGMPISTTHAISAAIMGVGLVRGARQVRWLVAGRIVAAWVLTIPGCFTLGWALRTLLNLLGA